MSLMTLTLHKNRYVLRRRGFQGFSAQDVDVGCASRVYMVYIRVHMPSNIVQGSFHTRMDFSCLPAFEREKPPVQVGP